MFGSRELQAVILALRTLDRDTRKEIRTHVRTMARPEWQKALDENASGRPLEHQVLARTGRVRVSDQNVTLTSATVGRALEGGLQPKQDYHAVEFGSAPKIVTYTARSRKGRTFRVKRNTRAPAPPQPQGLRGVPGGG